MWAEISPCRNWRGWLWAVGTVLVLAAFNFLEAVTWP
ncbi:hypothetical protein HMPREF0326_05646 [Desulfovibrio sp. 3_1_syn3]|nr:hypothetical protein HMPREF0326_05646 [Desulfovibrio sp. 3_1_syn3]